MTQAKIVTSGIPPDFTPGVLFNVRFQIRNIGVQAAIFTRLTDLDTGETEIKVSMMYPDGFRWWGFDWVKNESTTFNARFEAGHIGNGEEVVDDTVYFTIPVAVAEGKADITGIEAPSSFTPNVTFDIVVNLRNDGEQDWIFARLINKDTGNTIKEDRKFLGSTGLWWWVVSLTLPQTTDFHGKIEAGHET